MVAVVGLKALILRTHPWWHKGHAYDPAGLRLLYLPCQVYGNVHWLALRRGHEMVSPPEGAAHVCHFRYRWRHTFERRQRKGYLAATSEANATQASHSLGGFSARHRKHKSWVVAQWRSSLFHMWSPSCRGMHGTRPHARPHARTHARTHTHKQARTRTRTYACICRPLHAAPRAAAPRRAPPPRALPPLRLTGGGGAPPRSIAPRPDGACPPRCRHRCPARARRRRPCAPYRGYCSRVAPGGRRRHGEPHAGPRGPEPPLGVHRLCRHAAGSCQRGRALARATTAASRVFAASRVRP